MTKEQNNEVAKQFAAIQEALKSNDPAVREAAKKQFHEFVVNNPELIRQAGEETTKKVIKNSIWKRLAIGVALALGATVLYHSTSSEN